MRYQILYLVGDPFYQIDILGWIVVFGIRYFLLLLTVKHNTNLFSIVGKKSGPGVYISEVVKGGAADVDGRLVQVKAY